MFSGVSWLIDNFRVSWYHHHCWWSQLVWSLLLVRSVGQSIWLLVKSAGMVIIVGGVSWYGCLCWWGQLVD